MIAAEQKQCEKLLENEMAITPEYMEEYMTMENPFLTDKGEITTPVAFIALMIITFLFLGAIVFQENASTNANNNYNSELDINALQTANAKTNNTTHYPIVIATWSFTKAVDSAYNALLSPKQNSLDAIIAGISECEFHPWNCGWSVGFGAKPDSAGEVTLDALIMYGPTHSAGAVGQLRNIKNAIGVAKAVMLHTTHTLLVGESATNFALMMGFEKEDLSSQRSVEMFEKWKNDGNCQPNSFWKLPGFNETCPPYYYRGMSGTHANANANYYWNVLTEMQLQETSDAIGMHNHDTIGMIAIDENGLMSVGCSTNGLRYKVHGRVGDCAIVGAGAYVEHGIGASVATGNGDVMMLFNPTRIAVNNMKQGMSVQEACDDAMNQITNVYKSFEGALICMDRTGKYAVSKYMKRPFHFVYRNTLVDIATIVEV